MIHQIDMGLLAKDLRLSRKVNKVKLTQKAGGLEFVFFGLIEKTQYKIRILEVNHILLYENEEANVRHDFDQDFFIDNYIKTQK